jgi:serine O-acetyltransferase
VAAGAWREDRARYGDRGWRQPSLWAIGLFRFGCWVDEATTGPLQRVLGLLYWGALIIVEPLTGVSLTKATTVGPGLRIHHVGPVVVHSDAVLGRNCTLEHGVTIGERHPGGGVPTLGDGVFLGAYAQVLGPVRVGHRAKVGALSVVLADVPDGATAVGSPARIHRGSA